MCWATPTPPPRRSRGRGGLCYNIIPGILLRRTMPRHTAEKPNGINRLYCLLVLTTRQPQTIIGIILIYRSKMRRMTADFQGALPGAPHIGPPLATIGRISAYNPAGQISQPVGPAGPSAIIGANPGQSRHLLCLTDTFFIRQSAYLIDYAGKTEHF